MLTQKQLAEKIGVSQQSVSFALSGRGTIKQETRDYILNEARKAGYRVNLASRGIRQGRRNMIGLIVSGNLHTLPNLMLSELRPILRKDKCHLTLFGAQLSDFQDPSSPPQYLTESFADGFLVMDDFKYGGQLSEQIKHYRIPTIWINEKHKENAVYPDEFSIAGRATCELASRHRGHILYFGAEDYEGMHYSTRERREGFLRAIESLGRSGEFFKANDLIGKPDKLHAAARSILSRKRKRPRVIITGQVADAQVFFTQACLLGLKLPKDLVIASFTQMNAVVGHLHFYTILVPLATCGKIGYERLLKRIEKPDSNLKSIAVDDFTMHDPSDFSIIHG